MNKLISKIYRTEIATALAIAIFFFADRWLKMIVLEADGRSWRLLGDFFLLRFVPNYYMAFSLPGRGAVLNAVIILIILALASYVAYLGVKKRKMDMEIVLMLLIIAGALSNFLDRLRYGHVIDYLDLRYFTVFNLADALITVSAIILIGRGLRRR